jgi:hypothetical protein
MSTPENKVKQWIDTLMRSWYPQQFRYRPPGVGRFGKNGMPDCTYLIPVGSGADFGVYVAIEAKVPGNSPTALQLKTLKDIRSCGGVAAVVTGKDITKMGAIKREIDRRILLANEKSGTQTIPAPEGNNILPSSE